MQKGICLICFTLSCKGKRIVKKAGSWAQSLPIYSRYHGEKVDVLDHMPAEATFQFTLSLVAPGQVR